MGIYIYMYIHMKCLFPTPLCVGIKEVMEKQTGKKMENDMQHLDGIVVLRK